MQTEIVDDIDRQITKTRLALNDLRLKIAVMIDKEKSLVERLGKLGDERAKLGTKELL